MAGHNKWSKIKHRKAVVDKRRGKVWTKVAKAIIVAAKNGGPDPTANLSLRYAMDEARYANMPRETVERAIQKGAGGGDTSSYETTRYEGYAPGGVAVIVDALTDNRTRTVSLVREEFVRQGGNLGASGCVAFLFQHRGQIVVDAKGKSEDQVMEIAIDAGALDVQPPPSEANDDDEPALWTILTEPTQFDAVKQKIEKSGLAITGAELAWVPETTVGVAGEAADQLGDLIDALEDLDDVQKVWTNAGE